MYNKQAFGRNEINLNKKFKLNQKAFALVMKKGYSNFWVFIKP